MSDGRKESQGPNPIEGRYANYYKVGYNALEFLIDFGQYYPDNGGEQIHTRIIMSPVYGRALLETLRESILQYEQTYGTIPDQDG